MNNRMRFCWLAVLLLLPAAGAAPLPDDAALDQPVTLTFVNQPLGQVLARVKQQTGARLTVDEHVGSAGITAVVTEIPARALLETLARMLHQEWKPAGEGAYCLTAPELHPPAVSDTPRLIARLAAAIPSRLRPLGGNASPPAASPSSVMEVVYASLRAPLLDALEEGEEIPFARLPSQTQQLLLQHHQEMTRLRLAPLLQPKWIVPTDRIGLRMRAGEGARTWELVLRHDRQAAQPPPAPGARPGSSAPPRTITTWEPVAWPSYWPGYQQRVVSAPDEPGVRSITAAAVEVARQAGVNLLLSSARLSMTPTVEAARGETVAEQLTSLLPAAELKRATWRESNKLFWLEFDDSRPKTPSPELERTRQLMEAALPPEYKPYFALDTWKRTAAARAPWVKLWNSLSDEQRKPRPQPLLVSELSSEQQQQLGAALQVQMVTSLWTALESALNGDLRRATLSLDLETPSSLSGLGMPRWLRLRDGQNGFAAGVVTSRPPMLRLLSRSDPLLRKCVDFEAKEEALGAAAAKLAEGLGAPLVVEEPKEEITLTLSLKRKPAWLLLHCLERRTGLQWSRREGVYVLATPVPQSALQDPQRTLQAIGRDVPRLGTGAGVSMVRQQLTREDQETLRRGAVSLGDLSVGAQEALRQMMYSESRGSLSSVENQWHFLARLSEARIFVTPQGDGNSSSLRLVLPGEQSIQFEIPSDTIRRLMSGDAAPTPR